MASFLLWGAAPPQDDDGGGGQEAQGGSGHEHYPDRRQTLATTAGCTECLYRGQRRVDRFRANSSRNHSGAANPDTLTPHLQTSMARVTYTTGCDTRRPSALSATPSPGTGDFGEYRIEFELGRGGMGVVYRAWQRRMDRPVALKVLGADVAHDPAYRSRFEREAAALARLDSPHVIQIYDHGELEGHLYLAMQLVQRPDLGQVIAGGPLPPRRALLIASQVAAALADAHSVEVVHRDVKPGNVLMRVRATPEDDDFAYLCDFGIARTAADAGSAPETAGVIGTLAYLAPERLDGRPASPASDVYALGCLLWALLTGAPPYSGSQLHVIRSHSDAPVPQLEGTDPRTRAVNALLEEMMAKRPEQRLTAASARRAIRNILSGRGYASAAAPARAEPTLPEPPAPRRWWPAVVALVIVGVLVVAVIGWLLLRDPARTAAERVQQGAPLDGPCRPTAVPGQAVEAGVQALLVCDAGPDVGELRVVALPDSAAVDTFLRTRAGQELTALPEGDCPVDVPARQRWERDGRRGTLLCFVLGENTRYAWTFDDLDVVAVLDGRPQVPFPGDVDAVAAFFDRAGYS